MFASADHVQMHSEEQEHCRVDVTSHESSRRRHAARQTEGAAPDDLALAPAYTS
jgi:hypothetical protein